MSDYSTRDDIVCWLRAHAVPLATTEAGNGFEDLGALGRMVGDSRVVSLGEATHGTREFFQLKHRVLEYLVSEHGFTVFAIEANWPESVAIDEYIRTGQGDAATALGGLYFWTWDTVEVLELIEWMRRWNKHAPTDRKLRFCGFDMQSPLVAARAVAGFFRRVDPTFAERAAMLLEPFDFTVGQPDQRSALEAEAHRHGLEELTEHLTREHQRYEALSSASDWARAKHQLRTIAQWDEMVRAPGGRSSGVRDRAMAENIGWLLDQEPPGARMVVWAHNGHVQRSGDSASIAPMGQHLAERFGDAVIAFGFAFNEGSFQAVEAARDRPGGLREFTVPPAPKDSLDAMLAATGLPLFALDLRALPSEGAVASWFAERHASRSIGSVFFDGDAADSYSFNARGTFDALLFVAKTSRARPNRKRRRAPTVSVDCDGQPSGWLVPIRPICGGYKAEILSAGSAERSIVIAGRPAVANGYGNVFRRVDVREYRGRRARLRATVHMVGSGKAQLWLRVDRPNDELGFFDNMQARPIEDGQHGEYTIEGDVSADAELLSFGLMLNGAGRVTLSAVQLDIVAAKADD